MGTLAVAAPGVLGNDTSPVAAFTTLTAATAGRQHDSTAGKLTFVTDGSFTFIPNVDWVGATTFTYRASDGVNLRPLPASHGGTAGSLTERSRRRRPATSTAPGPLRG